VPDPSVDAGGGRRHLRSVSSVRHSARTRVIACVLALGVVLLAAGFTLEAGATGAVKAIKMSAKLAAGKPAEAAESPAAVGRA